MTCKNCGAELSDDARFCENCGTSLDSTENNAPETTPEITDTPAAPSYPMGWYKFLIYFSLFAGAVLNAFSAVSAITGMQYETAETSAELVYLIFPSLKSVDTMYGVALLALAAFAVFTRFALAKYKTFAPLCLYITYGAGTAVSLIYSVAVSNIIKTSVFEDPAIIASIVTSIVMIVINVVYFNKRKELFTN